VSAFQRLNFERAGRYSASEVLSNATRKCRKERKKAAANMMPAAAREVVSMIGELFHWSWTDAVSIIPSCWIET